MNLKLTQSRFARERKSMEEYNQGEDRPDYKVTTRSSDQTRDHLTRDTIGLKDVIEHASLQTFRTFYEERYVPNQMIPPPWRLRDSEMSEKPRRLYAVQVGQDTSSWV
jgi:predicted Zn-dependent peptidase